jgi:hypothetical protein
MSSLSITGNLIALTLEIVRRSPGSTCRVRLYIYNIWIPVLAPRLRSPAVVRTTVITTIARRTAFVRMGPDSFFGYDVGAERPNDTVSAVHALCELFAVPTF